MAERFVIQQGLVRVADGHEPAAGAPRVCVFSSENDPGVPPDVRSHADDLSALEPVENTYLNIYDNCFVGSFAVPSKVTGDDEPAGFSFYLDEHALVFLDSTGTCLPLLEKLSSTRLVKDPTPAYCLYLFMRALTRDDQSYMEHLEDDMEAMEEGILKDRLSDDAINQRLLNYRRKVLKLGSYYRQLATMADDLADNDNDLLTEAEMAGFEVIRRNANRLESTSGILHEYSVQLREMHNTQISAKQNDVMQMLTVVTAMFLPLTLLTGWFGMNFVHMPLLSKTWSYPAFICLVVCIAVGEFVFFHRRKML